MGWWRAVHDGADAKVYSPISMARELGVIRGVRNAGCVSSLWPTMWGCWAVFCDYCRFCYACYIWYSGSESESECECKALPWADSV